MHIHVCMHTYRYIHICTHIYYIEIVPFVVVKAYITLDGANIPRREGLLHATPYNLPYFTVLVLCFAGEVRREWKYDKSMII